MKRTLTVAFSVALLLACSDDRELLAPTPPASHSAAADGPLGFIEEPRIGAYSPNVPNPRDRKAATEANLDRVFTFTGWVSFPPDPDPKKNQLLVLVDNFGDGGAFTGLTIVRSARASSEPKMVGGRLVYPFSIGPFKPFRAVVGKPWPDGGTARIQIWAFNDTRIEELHGRDVDGVEGNPVRDFSAQSLVFADKDATPVRQADYSRGFQPLYPIPPYLGKNNKRGDPEQTRKYYGSVYTTPTGKSEPLLFPLLGTISRSLSTLKKFQERYFTQAFFVPPGVPLHCPAAGLKVDDPSPAIYFNKGDLGIGREMHCSYNACTQETACYVRNYGKPGINRFFATTVVKDRDSSKLAIDLNQPFATVAMVSRGQMPAGAANKVFFAVYDQTDALADVAQLDNRKYNTFIPGNCLVCHGAAGSFDPMAGVTNAYFLPFDLQHGLAYYSTGLNDPLSRESQEAKFKKLNRIVATTDFYRELPEARALLNGFYGHERNFDVNFDRPGGDQVDPERTWRSDNFQDNWVPPAWDDASGNTRQLYRRVVAKFCRTCHISDPGIHFGNYNDFNRFVESNRIWQIVCGPFSPDPTNIMPNAEVTSKNFWRSDARAQLVQRTVKANVEPFIPGCGLQ